MLRRGEERARAMRLPGRNEPQTLSGFISDHMEEIVAQWEEFAHTLLPAAATMTSLALRDHAGPILHAIAKDLGRARGPAAPLHTPGEETAATMHGALRHLSGFSLT